MIDVEQLLGPEWTAALPKAAELLESIRQQLRDERESGVTVLPQSNNIFRMFKEMPPEKIRVIFLGQDPYHSPIGQATGRAFECGKHPSATWRKMMDVYKVEVPGFNPQVVQGGLQTWVDQGVFLLNKSLSVRFKMPNSHTRFWEPFTRYAIGVALTNFNPKAVVLLGSEAQKSIPKVPHPHKGFLYEHPAAASYQGREWYGKGMFTEINKFLAFHGEAIKW